MIEKNKRKMNNMIGGAKLAMEQIQIRLNTVSELGDVVVTLSPCMSIIKGLSPSLSGIMPEANASMQDLSEILGDVMSGSSVTMDNTLLTWIGNFVLLDHNPYPIWFHYLQCSPFSNN